MAEVEEAEQVRGLPISVATPKSGLARKNVRTSEKVYQFSSPPHHPPHASCRFASVISSAPQTLVDQRLPIISARHPGGGTGVASSVSKQWTESIYRLIWPSAGTDSHNKKCTNILPSKQHQTPIQYQSLPHILRIIFCRLQTEKRVPTLLSSTPAPQSLGSRSCMMHAHARTNLASWIRSRRSSTRTPRRREECARPVFLGLFGCVRLL